ncbi:hypothetical protein [Cupriavidus sp. D39]|uniref:hypothetical protein n=1 Tax=Cupriavidus sp. D39 TaxID=2997877 RepID=UPI002270F85B|nr:hypothetical protein [Cupriavidus sp. D39]MCY0856659.1 hypothetical protein [Cupriavidus sp. D39]
MARDINQRLKSLQARRQGTDRLAKLGQDSALEILAKSFTPESYVKRAPSQSFTRYALGAMQAVDPEYTRISLEEAERVGGQLERRLSTYNISVALRLQGSVPCNIHIRGVSDVDLLVLDDRFFTYDTTGRLAGAGYYRNPVPYTPLSALVQLRSVSERILRDAYPAADVDARGSKAINISGGSLRRPVDVVPSHWYNTLDYQASLDETDRGVMILDKSVPTSILNMPFRHIQRISQRDTECFEGLKKAIRLCKHVKADAVEEGTNISISSFDIASTLWHADRMGLCAGVIDELSILAETTRFLDYLARNLSEAQKLWVPDGTRKIFDSTQKLNGLIQFSLELDDLALQVAREHNQMVGIFAPQNEDVQRTLKGTRIPQ